MRTGLRVRRAVLLAVHLAALAFFLGNHQARAALSASVDPAQRLVFPRDVTLTPDQAFARLDGYRPLMLDLYQIPSKPKDAPRPLIVFVHGGSWLQGDARHAAGFDDFPALLASLAAKNYVVASVNYRLAHEAHFPAPVQDVKSAVRWLRTRAADYNIDTTRVMIWGAGAGGEIAALVGASCGVNVLEPAADQGSKAPLASDCVQGVIDWAGPVDLASWDSSMGRAAGTETPLGAYLGCEPADCAPGMVKTASPLSYLEATTPPFLIQHGEADAVVPVTQSRTLYDALQALHVPSTLVVYPEVGENFARNGTADPAVQAKVIADMEDFIAKTFPLPPPRAEKSRAPRAIPRARNKRR